MNKTRFAFLFWALAIVGLSLDGGRAFAQSDVQELRIHRHARIPALNLKPVNNAPRARALAKQSETASNTDAPAAIEADFDAFGKTFVMQLLPNSGFVDQLPSAQKRRLKKKVQTYRGTLQGVANSWVRLNKVGPRLSGMIWDGQEIYVIDNSQDLAGALDGVPTDLQTPFTLVYRLKDSEWRNSECALAPGAGEAGGMSGLVQELRSIAAQTQLPADREISVAIVADTHFMRLNSLDPEAAVLGRMNIVDGIFSEQVGVHLKIAQIRLLDDNGLLTATDPRELLRQFSAFVNTPAMGNPGIAHLFTGRGLGAGAAGIAYTGGLCSPIYGVGLSELRRTGTAGALIVAHEIGHNFGAPHDNSASSICGRTPGRYIMNPAVNGATQFSPCSLSRMLPRVETAACITPVSTRTANADLRPTLPVNPIGARVGEDFSYRVEISNIGAAAATNVRVSISIPEGLGVIDTTASAGACTVSAGTVHCTQDAASEGTTSAVTLTLRAARAGDFPSQVSVSADNDAVASNDTAQALIQVNGTVFDAHFDQGGDGFEYVDDAFRATAQPEYASGILLPTGGLSGAALAVRLGGIDAKDILKMSGAWRRAFRLDASRRLTLSLRFKLDQAANYERDEVSQALLAVDGRLLTDVVGKDYLAQIRGNGTGGPTQTTGWRQVTLDLGVLDAGDHVVTIGAYNNKKTYSDEMTEMLIDDVSLQ